MLIQEALGYDRFGRRYVSSEEIAERKKRILAVDFLADNKKESTPPKCSPQIIHQKHLKWIESERKAKVIQAQIFSFMALAIADMSVGVYHALSQNPTLVAGDVLCAATAFSAGAVLTIHMLKKTSLRQNG